jgi:hypothetical protein
VVTRIKSESFWLFRPDLIDVLIGSETAKGLEPLCEVAGHEEGLDVLLKLSMRSVVVAFDGGLFERAVHPFDLAVGPGVIGLREPVLDVVFVANAVEHVASPQRRRPHAILWQIGELDAVVREHGADFVRNGFDKGFEEVRGRLPLGLFVQFCIGEI